VCGIFLAAGAEIFCFDEGEELDKGVGTK